MSMKIVKISNGRVEKPKPVTTYEPEFKAVTKHIFLRTYNRESSTARRNMMLGRLVKLWKGIETADSFNGTKMVWVNERLICLSSNKEFQSQEYAAANILLDMRKSPPADSGAGAEDFKLGVARLHERLSILLRRQ